MTFQEEDLDEVVISGIGGKFPDAENVNELAEKLFAGEHLVTKDARKLTKGFYEDLPEYNGKTQTNSVLFDNTFFGISAIVATTMDPLTCQILQRTFEAVIDAGINPSELRGTNSCVFSGTSHSDSDLEWATDKKTGYGIMGKNRCMNSNRVSYWLDLNGHSVSTEAGWTNGLANLYLGWRAIKNGECDVAIVSTANIQCHALITIKFKDFGFLSHDGLSRTFDDSGDGFGRSSAVVVFVLQRARHARRSYATIGHIYSTCFGDRDNIIQKPSQQDWETLFKDFYKDSKIDVDDVQYIEAHGSSLRDEDAEELNAITEVFCKNRKSPLLVGCVKSNIGHTEAASSFCGIVKNIISLEKGVIPQNLHYKTPNALCPALFTGQIKVVDKNTPVPGNGWFAVNCHGFGGSYAHVVLKANPKRKEIRHDNIPRLVLLSDRTDEFIGSLIEKVEKVPYDPEYIGLLHEVHGRRVEKYLSRGYTILPVGQNPVHEHQTYGEEKRPVWFVFSGMGSQWPKMGRRLMDLPIFRESIEKSHKLLEKEGLDLINIITTEDPNIFDNILHSFVGIASMQIALVDIMRALNITPDGLIGHSVGELGCAYADGCFTAEQMLLAAYYRGRASVETELIKGSMAAVGQGYNEIKDKLPEGIEVACHNSENSCTLSGPVDLIHKFVAELKEKGIFARAVNASNIAYHSQYIKPAAPKLLSYLKKVVTEPKLRSSKWISTSNPESQWDTDLAKYCSAEYHTNNLLSSVLFEEGSKHIPENAICIEIAPHGLLQAILKRSMGEGVTNIPLTSRSAEDSIVFLLQAVGRMYMAGINPQVINLYPKIQYPVSRGTPTLHDLVHWHEKLMPVVTTPMEKKIVYSLKNRLVSTAEDGIGYIADGENIYPLAIFLHLAWDLYASFQKTPTEECPVVFENFRIARPVAVHLSKDDNGALTFETGSGNFEIMTNEFLASGKVSLLKEKPLELETKEVGNPDLDTNDIYLEIKRKGYDVGKHFRNLSWVAYGNEELVGEIPVNSNWVQSIESLIQLYILKTDSSLGCTLFPHAFDRLEISSLEHKNFVNDSSSLTVTYNDITNTAVCGGIRLRGLKSIEVPKSRGILRFPSTNFFPLMNPSLENSLRFADFCFEIVLDNLNATKNLTVINVLEMTEETSVIGTHLQKFFCDYKLKLKTMKNTTDVKQIDLVDFIISPLTLVDRCGNYLIDGGFVLLKTSPGNKIPPGFNIIGRFLEGTNEEFLFLKKIKTVAEDKEFLSMDGTKAVVLNSLKELKSPQKTVYLVGHKEPAEGIVNFKKTIETETGFSLRWILILDEEAPKFNSRDPFYAEHLKKGLTTNVYKNGSWGSFCEYNFSDSSFQNDVNFTLEASDEIKPSFVSFDLSGNLLKLEQVEYSGKMSNRNVMGISRLINHKMVLDKYLNWEIPESWSLEEGASVPMSYALAYFCLVTVADVKKSEAVLVTDGMSCIGQAAVSLALSICSRVIVTVGNDNEAILIRKQFPQLKEEDVICHEDLKFNIQSQFQTKDVCADIIINTLHGERFFSVLDFVKPFGKFFHFGNDEAVKNTQLGTSIFIKSLAFQSISPEIIVNTPEEDRKSLHEAVSAGIKSGIVRPLPRVVLTFNQIKNLQSKDIKSQDRIKTLVAFDTIKPNDSYMRFDSKSSYLILGDETDTWIDVAEWLVERGQNNVVVGRRDHTKRSHLRMPRLKNNKSLSVYDSQDVEKLLQEAKKLGPVSAVYYIAMNTTEVNKALLTLDKCYRDAKSHFLALTKSQGFISELCTVRTDSGFPSTNFIWDADETLIKENLEFMGKLCGKNSIIHVSKQATFLNSEWKLVDLLPPTMNDLCSLGSSLKNEVRLTPLQTTAGVNREAIKEFTPVIFVPGLHNDPVEFLQPMVSNFLYPAYCLEIPDMKMSIPKMASFILPELIKFNKGKVFNIVGISWGTHLAMELAKQLEEVDAVVGLILVEGPLLNAKALITTSLEFDLLNLIQGYSKATTNFRNQNEVLVGKTWQAQLNHTLNVLNLPPEKEKDFYRAAMFIYDNLQALLNHDTGSINLKGPLTVVVSDQHTFDDKVIWKISNSIGICCLPKTSEELLPSKDLWKIIHGAAVSQAMSSNTIHSCSWQALEEFMNQKKVLKLGHDFQVLNMKFSFTF